MRISGGCHCGAITYVAEIDPDMVSVCHCTDCQMLTGSPYRVTAMTHRDRIDITAGTPRLYVKTADSGRRRKQFFCSECGSPLFTTGDGANEEEWGIRWGSIAQRAQLQPRRQIWCMSAAPWVDGILELPGREDGS